MIERFLPGTLDKYLYRADFQPLHTDQRLPGMSLKIVGFRRMLLTLNYFYE